jgi:NADH-quinone oxidoreductase subunit M
LLAGILLKLGVYGFLRFSLVLFPEASFFYSPIVYLLSVLGILYASTAAIRQTDLKRIIAYSSIAHMNFGILGLFSLNLVGIQGSLFLMLAHGIVSAALFFCIGVLYERHHSRNLFYYGGLVQTMPLFSFYFLLFSFANIGLPGTCNFIGELLIILGLVSNNFFVLVFFLSYVFSTCEI